MLNQEIEEEYRKDRNFLDAEQLEKERKLWKWDFETNEELTMVDNNSLYLYNNSKENLQPILQNI